MTFSPESAGALGVGYVIENLDNWPPADFGTLMDRFTFPTQQDTSAGSLDKAAFSLLAKGVFGEVPKIEWNEAGWPEPARLARMVTPKISKGLF